MSEIIKRPFRSFNGTDWDKHYFDTSADQVKYTESDGSETELQAKIEKINDNLEFLNYGYAMYPDKSIHHATWQDVSESIKQKNPGNNIFFDTGSYHISVDREGTYLVIAQALFDANNSGVRGCRILVNDGNSTESPEFTWIPNSAMPFPVDVT